MSGRAKQNIIMHEMDREGVMAEGREACQAVDLRGLSDTPQGVFHNTLDHTGYDNLVYSQSSGKAVAPFMRLWELKFPYDIDTGDIYHCETKRDALKVLTCQGLQNVIYQVGVECHKTKITLI